MEYKRSLCAIICLVSFALLSGCGGGSSEPKAQAAQQQPQQPGSQQKTLPGTLIILGNSIMAGCAESVDEAHPDYTMTTAHLVAREGLRVINLSRSGNGISQAESLHVEGGIHFTQGDKRGTAIWIALGINDFLWEFATVDQYRDRYLKVLSRIQPIPGQKIFCVTPLMSGIDYRHQTNSEGSTLEGFREVVREIATEGHCTLVDTTDWFTAGEIYDENHVPDTIHLGKEGHRHYSMNLLEAIEGDYSAKQ